ncbi:condensation domain-containing protein [Streptomyces malaysiensis]|uniref:condensation domain-containing protein n=1 Tax=Streptomyces malaysiensis TaxID=92644 RepID=UPI00371B0C4B
MAPRNQLEPDNPSYNVPIALRLRGPLDLSRLRWALTAVGERHEVLRTRFEEQDGRPVARASEEPRIRFVQVRPGPGESPERAALERAAADAGEPFDLRDGPLVRATLTRLSEDEHLLAICTHHIVFDGWSVSVLIRDLHAAYTGEPQKPLPIQYADYAAWQTAWLKDGALDDQLAHWTSALADLPPALDLPTDRPRPATASGGGALLHGRIGPETAQRLRALAHAEGTTLFSALYAAFGAVLMRRFGQDSAVIGVPVANRSRAEAEDGRRGQDRDARVVTPPSRYPPRWTGRQRRTAQDLEDCPACSAPWSSPWPRPEPAARRSAHPARGSRR